MALTLTLISIALSALAEFVTRARPTLTWRWDVARLVGLLFLATLTYGLVAHFAPKPDITTLMIGLGLGLVITGLLSGRPTAPGAEPVSFLPSIGLGVAVASVVHLIGAGDQTMVQFGLLFGVGLGSLVLSSSATNACAITVTFVVAADFLSARHSTSLSAPFLGSFSGLFALIGGLMAYWLPKSLKIVKGLAVGLIMLGAAVIYTKSITELHILTCLCTGLVAAVVIDWLLTGDEPDGVRLGLSAVIGIGVGTLAFGLAHGAGMALGLVSMGGLLLVLGNPKAILALGPLTGLVLYRVFSEVHPGSSHALDLGQHYALNGFAFGVVLPLIPLDWLQKRNLPGAIGAALWGLLVFGTPVLVLLVFGDKGAIGLLVGVGFSGIVQALRKGSDLLPVALVGSLGVTMILSLSWIPDLTDIERSEKMKFFAIASGCIAVLAVAITALSFLPSKSKLVADPAE